MVQTAQQAETMISLRNLRVSYGDREILHGISFDVMRAETLVILGGSGSGKSTLLRTLVGLERPSSGEIWLRGKNLAAISSQEMDEIRKRIGMSFQGGALFGSMVSARSTSATPASTCFMVTINSPRVATSCASLGASLTSSSRSARLSGS